LEKVREVSNIRNTYDQGDLDDLAESIRERGQLVPILVYQEGNEYCIIVGHRRVRAMRQVGITEVDGVILPKPSEVELLYIQIHENEQSKTLSGADRERCILRLLEQGERQKDICAKLCLSQAWVSRLVIACEFRRRFGEKFSAAGIDLEANTAYRIAAATEEAIDRAIEEIQETPERKSAILDKLAESSARRKGHSYKRTEQRVFEVSGAEPGVQVTSVMTVNRQAQTITLRYDGGVEVVEGLSEAIRELEAGWFGRKEAGIFVTNIPDG
jgi:ParB family chromosome partitioning protein